MAVQWLAVVYCRLSLLQSSKLGQARMSAGVGGASTKYSLTAFTPPAMST